MDLKAIREDCGVWDEEYGCLDGTPNECPYHVECQKDSEKEEDDE